MEPDNDLREMFHRVADEDVAIAPAFSRQWIAAQRAKLRAHRLAPIWYSAVSLAAVGAVASILVIANQAEEPEMVELPDPSPMYSAPSDFLLITPGSDFLSSLPEQEFLDGAPTAALPRRDSSED